MWINVDEGEENCLGFGYKVNLQASLHTAMMIFLLMKQYVGKKNDAYLPSFKLMISTLKITDGDNFFKQRDVKKGDRRCIRGQHQWRKDRFAAIFFILRSDKST